MKKLYFFLSFFLALGGRQAVHAQDSSVCNAAFQATVAGTAVSFRAMDSMPGVRHNWNFGDSTSKSTDSFVVNHVYSANGNYLVTQVVLDSVHNCRDSASQWVNIGPPPTCNVYVTESLDTTDNLYTFIANTSVTPGATDTVRWTINDTLVATGDTLKRQLRGGLYTVCALLTTSYSCQSQSCLTVNPQDSVSTPPPPPDTCTIAFTAVPKDHKPNQYVFTVINSEEYDSISWTIMGGPDSLFAGPYHGPSFSYTFADSGYYAVYVTAEKRSGCLVRSGQYVQIDSVPGPTGHYINSYPNPATTQVTLYVTLDEYTAVDIRVYNSMGGLVLSRSVSAYPGVNQITLPIANLPMGVYYIELQYGGTILRSKIQKR
jgi:hypothetical protein